MTQEEIERLTVLLHDGYPCGQIGCRETGETFAALVAEVRRLRGVVEAARAYEKWMGKWHDYSKKSGLSVSKPQTALIAAVRALDAAKGAQGAD